jgi:hypothetical protein
MQAFLRQRLQHSRSRLRKHLSQSGRLRESARRLHPGSLVIPWAHAFYALRLWHFPATSQDTFWVSGSTNQQASSCCR